MGKQPIDDPDRELLSTCSECGLKMQDNDPRGVWVKDGVMGVYCITCAEADQEAVKFDIRENPTASDGKGEPGGIIPF